MSEIIMRYREARAGELGLFPVDEEGFEELGKCKVGRDVGADVKRRRNPRHHRLFFAIVRFLQTHTEMFAETPTEKVKNAIKLATGLADTFIDAETGKTFYVLRSMSWSAMDQTEFDKFFNDACVVIANRWMPPGTTAESVRAELLAMVEDPRAIGSRVA